MNRQEILAAVTALHQRIDRETAPLNQQHAARLKCRLGCSACCVDDLTVFAVEALAITANYPDLLAEGEPGPRGACAFLDRQGACRIYAHRPYVCRTQGLPLRWLEEDEDELVEYRDICPLNEQGPPLESLEPEDCWTLGEAEGELAQLQIAVDKRMKRVALRDLFTRPGQDSL